MLPTVGATAHQVSHGQDSVKEDELCRGYAGSFLKAPRLYVASFHHGSCLVEGACARSSHKVALDKGPKRPHKHDAADHGFWNSFVLGSRM